jgi:hypothetical protein
LFPNRQKIHIYIKTPRKNHTIVKFIVAKQAKDTHLYKNTKEKPYNLKFIVAKKAKDLHLYKNKEKPYDRKIHCCQTGKRYKSI